MFNIGDVVSVPHRRGVAKVCGVGEITKIGQKYDLKMGKESFVHYEQFMTLVAPAQIMVEWVDPGTGETHVCPETYINSLKKYVSYGKSSALTSIKILTLMGEENNESNKRHVRQAALFLKQQGIPLISYRSSKGGYFIAETVEEVEEYAEQQHKLADSMKKEADALINIFKKNYVQVN